MDSCPSPRTFFVWLNVWERAAFVAVVCGILIANGFNIALSIQKLIRANESPSVAISNEKVAVVPPLNVLLCSPDPFLAWDRTRFLCLWFRFYTNGTQVQDFGPCPGLVMTIVAQYNCAYMPVGGPGFRFGIGGDFDSVIISGALEVCVQNKIYCGLQEIYFQVSIAGDVESRIDALRAAKDLSEESASPVRPGERTSVLMDIWRDVNLAGQSRTTLRPRQIPMGPLALAFGGLFANQTFAIDFNDLSFPSRQLVYTEVLSYDFLDLVSSVAAVASLTYTVLRLVFPSSPSVPLHFRCGRHARHRRMGSIAETHEEFALSVATMRSNKVRPTSQGDESACDALDETACDAMYDRANDSSANK
eukprot:Amastigsp_a677310_384.p2 type:complete len:362 gc:universal Amastigsp_a677310_384:34-1119(+)